MEKGNTEITVIARIRGNKEKRLGARLGSTYTKIRTIPRLAWLFARMTHRFLKHSIFFSNIIAEKKKEKAKKRLGLSGLKISREGQIWDPDL